jgi:TonB family protein
MTTLLRMLLMIFLSLAAQEALASTRSDCDPTELVGLAPIRTPFDLDRDKSWTVTMAAAVSDDGSLSKARIVKSSKSPVVDRAVMAAVAKIQRVTGACHSASTGTLFLKFTLRGDGDVRQHALRRAWRERDERTPVISNHE